MSNNKNNKPENNILLNAGDEPNEVTNETSDGHVPRVAVQSDESQNNVENALKPTSTNKENSNLIASNANAFVTEITQHLVQDSSPSMLSMGDTGSTDHKPSFPNASQSILQHRTEPLSHLIHGAQDREQAEIRSSIKADAVIDFVPSTHEFISPPAEPIEQNETPRISVLRPSQDVHAHREMVLAHAGQVICLLTEESSLLQRIDQQLESIMQTLRDLRDRERLLSTVISQNRVDLANFDNHRNNFRASGADNEGIQERYPQALHRRNVEARNVQVRNVPERYCWICYEIDGEDFYGEWCGPCHCTDGDQWVHRGCILNWYDPMQQYNWSRAILCPVCQFQYTIRPLCFINCIRDLIVRCESFIDEAEPFFHISYIYAGVYSIVTAGESVIFAQEQTRKIISSNQMFSTLVTTSAVTAILFSSFTINWRSLIHSIYNENRSWIARLPYIGHYFAARRAPVPRLPILNTDNQHLFTAVQQYFASPATFYLYGRILFINEPRPCFQMVFEELTFVFIRYGYGVLRRRIFRNDPRN